MDRDKLIVACAATFTQRAASDIVRLRRKKDNIYLITTILAAAVSTVVAIDLALDDPSSAPDMTNPSGGKAYAAASFAGLSGLTAIAQLVRSTRDDDFADLLAAKFTMEAYLNDQSAKARPNGVDNAIGSAVLSLSKDLPEFNTKIAECAEIYAGTIREQELKNKVDSETLAPPTAPAVGGSVTDGGQAPEAQGTPSE